MNFKKFIIDLIFCSTNIIIFDFKTSLNHFMLDYVQLTCNIFIIDYLQQLRPPGGM